MATRRLRGQQVSILLWRFRWICELYQLAALELSFWVPCIGSIGRDRWTTGSIFPVASCCECFPRLRTTCSRWTWMTNRRRLWSETWTTPVNKLSGFDLRWFASTFSIRWRSAGLPRLLARSCWKPARSSASIWPDSWSWTFSPNRMIPLRTRERERLSKTLFTVSMATESWRLTCSKCRWDGDDLCFLWLQSDPTARGSCLSSRSPKQSVKERSWSNSCC